MCELDSDETKKAIYGEFPEVSVRLKLLCECKRNSDRSKSRKWTLAQDILGKYNRKILHEANASGKNSMFFSNGKREIQQPLKSGTT